MEGKQNFFGRAFMISSLSNCSLLFCEKTLIDFRSPPKKKKKQQHTGLQILALNQAANPGSQYLDPAWYHLWQPVSENVLGDTSATLKRTSWWFQPI